MEKIGRIFHQFCEDYIKDNCEGLNCLFVVRYSGVASPKMSNLRQTLKSCQGKLFVSKNNISRRVFDGLGLKEISKMLQGPCGLVFGKGDPVSVSKALYIFSKENENLKIEGGLLKDKILSASQVIALANLPVKEVLYAKVVWTLKSPLNQIVWTLSGLIKKLVYVLDQIKNKRPNSYKEG